MRSIIRQITLAAVMGCCASGAMAQASPFPVAVNEFTLIPGQGAWAWSTSTGIASAQLSTHYDSDEAPPTPPSYDPTRAVVMTESGWFKYKAADLLFDASVDLAPVQVQGTHFVQAFTTQSAFKLLSDAWFEPQRSYINATITGGRISGELGSEFGLTLELDLTQVTSDLLALADNHGTFTATAGGLMVRNGLHLTCASPAAGCDGQTQYLDSYDAAWWQKGSFSPNLLAAPVPEPGAVGLALLGLAGLAWRGCRQNA